MSLILACGIAILALGVAEIWLRRQQQRIASSDDMDAALIRHDSELGWTLTPDVTGSHRHHDFSVRYRIASTGFRHDPALPATSAQRRVAILGDSFSFGLGVGDDQTFTHHLNARAKGTTAYFNCSTPGYSTDQELLSAKRSVLALRPATVLLVVCLPNDFVDNQFPHPMQVNHAKPWFRWVDGKLELQGVPVPLEYPRRPGAGDVMLNILGREYLETSWRNRMDRRSELFRRAADALLPHEDWTPSFDEATRPSLKLFWALIDDLHAACTSNGALLHLAGMPGKSGVNANRSPSGSYQIFMNRKLEQGCHERGLVFHDLISPLKQATVAVGARACFFPYDGHLTSYGHRVISDALAPNL